MEFMDFVKPELLVLIPVLYFCGVGIKKSKISDKFIPLILGVISIALSALWVFAMSNTANGREVATAIFTAITQGILLAGASVYANQIYKQSKEDDDNDK